jgi:hypothetical protein
MGIAQRIREGLRAQLSLETGPPSLAVCQGVSQYRLERTPPTGCAAPGPPSSARASWGTTPSLQPERAGWTTLRPRRHGAGSWPAVRARPRKARATSAAR